MQRFPEKGGVESVSGRALVVLIMIALVAMFIFMTMGFSRIFQRAEITLQEYDEDIVDFLAPNAAREFSYGERHFSAEQPAAYDIDRAERFFDEAALRDPKLPYVYHELARIAFLKGNFGEALGFIDSQIALQGDKTPNSYYVRGLIEGYSGDYTDAEIDYAHYLTYDPIDWAAVNDYSWVLLKDNKPAAADAAITAVLNYFPTNAWLLNSDAIALSELGATSTAQIRIDAAARAIEALTPDQWSAAYPGNDPRIAEEGLAAFQTAVKNNMHTIDNGGDVPAVQ
jgi:predicted Zn-dependent protease